MRTDGPDGQFQVNEKSFFFCFQEPVCDAMVERNAKKLLEIANNESTVKTICTTLRLCDIWHCINEETTKCCFILFHYKKLTHTGFMKWCSIEVHQLFCLLYKINHSIHLFLKRLFWANHLFGANPGVKLLGSQESGFDRFFLQRSSILVGRLCNLCRIVVSNVGVKSCHQHQWFIQQLLDILLICFDPVNTVIGEWIRPVGQESYGL